ncbi:undecaprenyl/decaprenyl-phosphate alpha-N-acetylglucosaminyl 1-phosphate transferase [Candidatus Parcubacteria bacterium]|jgi:UDP-GlcNAc:undecaprenyl-phosphate/decaprenyl-phosphate GlcNAc-1-phosphate transferase|nr:undecaprenyl/decaprenyl-phosphate alpha-N-acetylglucosaminyl 1-phosphate transferase [Candidatus Parcubacteria bacterium]
MPDYIKFILVFLIAFVLSFVFTKFIIWLAHRQGILDHPGADRKIHTKPVPLLGGIAVYASFFITIFILWQSHQLTDERISLSMLAWFLLAGLVLIINGALDDKYSLPAQVTVWGPVLASLIIIFAGLKISYITHPEGGVLQLDSLFSSLSGMADFIPMLLTFVWLMGITYTTKLLDGIDGLTSSIGLVASVVIFVVSLSWDIQGSTTSLLALVLAGAIFGFLLLNWHPAKVFLGEGGSTFIGFSLGVLSIISGSKIATALLVMGLPVLDIIWVIIRRLRQKKAFWRADKQHLHFRLLSAGLSQKQVVIFLSTISLCFGVISILFTTKAKIGALIILLVLMLLLSSWLNYRLKQKK